MFKKMLSFVLTAVLTIVLLGSVVSAAEISPYYSYTSRCSSTLIISGTTATCNSAATGYDGETTKIVVEQTLEKKTLIFFWSTVDSWNTTVIGSIADITKTKSGLSDGTYRLKTVFTVYAGSNYETITVYSSERKV